MSKLKVSAITPEKKCPFCGAIPGTQSWSRVRGELTTHVARVACECGACGPERYGDMAELLAVQVWNTRR